MSATQLFPPWEPPPAFQPRPADGGLAQRIAKLTEFVARNGAQFEEMMRQKQHGNPEFAFLFGGEGGPYYRWVLYCTVHQLNPELPLESQPGSGRQPGGGGYNAADALPPELRTEFGGVLDRLNGTKEVIKSSQRQFLQHYTHAAGLAAMMHQRCQQCGDYTKQLHLIYLINDILVHSVQSSATQPELLQVVRDGFHPVLSSILATAYAQSGKSDDAKQRLQKIVNMWGDRGVFSQETAAALSASAFEGEQAAASMPQAVAPPQGGYPPSQTNALPPWQAAMPPPPQPPPPGMQAPPQHPPPWGGPPPPMMSDPMQSSVPPWAAQQPHPPQHMPPHPGPMHAAGYPPPHMPPPPHSAPPAPWHPPPHPPAPFAPPPMHPPPHNPPMMPPPQHAQPGFHPPVPPPQPPPEEPPQPVNPMCFPPGILPKLVDVDADRPYTPLQLEAIQKEGLPAPGEMDAYLQARLDKFFAEVHDYHGTKTRAQLLSDRGKDPRGMLSESRLDRLQPGSSDSSRMDVDPTTGMRPDGSFALGRGDRAKGGLGSHNVHNHDSADDPYSMYRKQRSGSYHKSAMAKSASAIPGQ